MQHTTRSALVALFLCLAGCSGIQLADEQTIACRNDGCAALTGAQLQTLLERAASAGYKRGWRDANVQAGRDV